MGDELFLGTDISNCLGEETARTPVREPATIEDIRDPYFVSERPEDLQAYMTLYAQPGNKR